MGCCDMIDYITAIGPKYIQSVYDVASTEADKYIFFFF